MNCIPKICIPNIVKNNYKWVLLGLLVVVLIAIIFFVCWIGSKLSNSDSEKTPSTIIITTPSLSRIDAGNNYIVTTNFARESLGSIPDSYVNDTFVIDLFNETTNTTTRLSSREFLLKNYYNRTVIISNSNTTVSNVTRVSITVTHGSDTIVHNTSIITRPTDNVMIVDFPAVWLYTN